MGVGANTGNPRTWKLGEGGPEVQSHPQLQSMFEACLKSQIKKKQETNLKEEDSLMFYKKRFILGTNPCIE